MPIFKNITDLYLFVDLWHAEVYATRLKIRLKVATLEQTIGPNKKMNAGYN